MHSPLITCLLGSGWLAGCLAAAEPQLPTTPTNAPAVAASGTNAPGPAAAADPAQAAYDRLMDLDETALEDVDRWIQEEQAQRDRGEGLPDVTLNVRVRQRLEPVRQAYEDFLKLYPRHARAHLAYGSFLQELGDEESALEHMEKSRELDPTNPASWNNLANYYGHRGPVTRAFEYYAKAIELNSAEPVYLHNLATTVFLFRDDAQKHFHLDEPAVFAKALDLYRQAIKLDPTNFVLATDYAQSFYGMLPQTRTNSPLREAREKQIAEQAIPAWEYALQIATDELQREGTLIHLARTKLLAGRTLEAREHLNGVTNATLLDLKQRVLKRVQAKLPAEAPPPNPDSASGSKS